MLENIAKITKNKGDSKRSEVEDDICRLYNELSGSLLARQRTSAVEKPDYVKSQQAVKKGIEKIKEAYSQRSE